MLCPDPRANGDLLVLRDKSGPNTPAPPVTTVPRSYVSCSIFRTCPSFSSMTSLTFYDLLPLTHAYDFHMLAISHVYDFHMLTVFTCFSFTYFVRLPCTI